MSESLEQLRVLALELVEAACQCDLRYGIECNIHNTPEKINYLVEAVQRAFPCGGFRGQGECRAVELAETLLPPGWSITLVDSGPSLCVHENRKVWLHGKATEFEAIEDALHEVAHAWLPDDLANRLHQTPFFVELAKVYTRAFPNG